MRLWSIPDNPPSHPEALIVPSYALKDRTAPTRPTRAQIELAVEWWRRFPRARIIMSTGDNQGLGVTNAQVMVDYAASLGVPCENLIQEDRSRNTRENLAFSMEIVKRERLNQPTLVTLDLYTRRAVATARKLGWTDFFWLSVSAKGESAFGLKAFQTHSRLTIFLYEQAAMLYSKVVGWV